MCDQNSRETAFRKFIIELEGIWLRWRTLLLNIGRKSYFPVKMPFAPMLFKQKIILSPELEAIQVFLFGLMRAVFLHRYFAAS